MEAEPKTTLKEEIVAIFITNMDKPFSYAELALFSRGF